MHCSGHFKPILVYKGDRFKKGFRQSGNDRDEYVANNNGGFTIGHSPAHQMHPGTTYVAGHPRAFNSLGRDKTVRNNVKSHIVIYRQNGTGRDTYILNNNGGFAIQEGSNPFCGYQNEFKRSLRQYAPIENRPSKTISSVSPVRYKSVAGNFANTLNRFKVFAKQDDKANDNSKSPINKQHGADDDVNIAGQSIQDARVTRNKFSAGHYRTQSQTINEETSQRIKEYLKQRQAYSRAQALNKSLSQNSNGSAIKNAAGSHSCGRLFANNERSQSQQRSRNVAAAKANTMSSLGKREAKEIVEDGDRKANEAVALTLAVKSTPSLNNAFNKRHNSQSRATTSRFFANMTTQQQQEMQTGATLTAHNTATNNFQFEKPANLNILSHDDLTNPQLQAEILAQERSRPMTTKFVSRRFTQQPQTNDDAQAGDVHGIYERHASPQKSAMQLFGEHQRSQMARLSVPKDNRRRDRFNGTQNIMLQTFDGEPVAAQQNPMLSTVNISATNGARKGSLGSFANGKNANTPRVKSSLLGTSARQKLLKYRLEAYQTSNGVDNEAKAQISGQIADLNKVNDDDLVNSNVADHLKTVNVALKEREAKKTQKERILEQVYKGQKPPMRTAVTGGSARQALKANLRQNMKVSTARQTDGFQQRRQSNQVETSAAKEFNKSSLV